jgi:hypothetical protein
MSESMRKTEARIAARELRRKRREERQKLMRTIPYGNLATPPRPANAGVIGPRLELDRDLIDFGDEHFGQAVQAVFNVKNVGDDTLNLNVAKVATAVEGC